MARYKGRVIVLKVDNKGVRIKGKLRDWIDKHPDTIYFDSMTEYLVWKYIKTIKLKYIYKPKLKLFDGMKTKEFKNNKVVEYAQRSISYTPEFYLPAYKAYIEVKGYADDVFKLRWKLFKLNGYDGYIVYSLVDFKTLIKELKNAKNS